MRNNAQLIDCIKVYNMIHTLEGLIEYLNDNVIDDAHILRSEMIAPLNETLEEFTKLKTMLVECIDMEKAKHHEYMINPNFSPELKSLEKNITSVRKAIEELRCEV